MEYLNPFGMMPANQDFGSGNALVTMNAERNRINSLPFIEAALGMQQNQAMMDAQKAKEFMSPEAQDARMTGFQSQTATNRANMEVAPHKAKFDVAKAQADLEALPYMTAKEIAVANQVAMEAKGKPAEKFIREMGSIHEQINAHPEAVRPALYQQAIQQWQAQNPGAQVPQNFAQYNPQLLGIMRGAQIRSVEHEQNIEKIKLKELFDLEGKQLEAQSRIRAAEAGRAATNEKRSPAQERVFQMRVYNNPNAAPEEKEVAYETLSGLASDAFEKVKKGDRFLSNMDVDYLTARSPEEKERITQMQSKRESQLWEDHLIKFGLRVKVQSPNGQTGTIPKHKLDEYKKQGYKEVK